MTFHSAINYFSLYSVKYTTHQTMIQTKLLMFRFVFWDVLPCKMYIPEDNSEHHTRSRENLKSHKVIDLQGAYILCNFLFVNDDINVVLGCVKIRDY
jgi:hypothetical protein